MKQTVTLADFREAFRVQERAYQFTYEGLEALYNMLRDFEDSVGEELELDVVALCCDFTEYETLEEVKGEYTHLTDVKDIEDLNDHTWAVEFNGGFIVQNF